MAETKSNKVNSKPNADKAHGHSSNSTDADEELLVRSLQGDADAYGLIVTKYQDKVYNLLLRFSKTAEEAEDLAQEAFIKAYRALKTFKRGSRFYTWLYRIAVNTAFSYQRKAVRRDQIEGTRLTGRTDSDDNADRTNWAVANEEDSDPTIQAEKNDLQIRVRQGLDELEPDHKAVILLRDMEGLDYEEVADALNISRAAVKSRLYRARAALAHKLKDLNK